MVIRRREFLTIVLSLVLGFGIMSCGDDDEVGNSIVGTWSAVDVVRMDCTNPNSDGTITLDCPTFCLITTFNSNGTASSTYTDPNSGSRTDGGTYTVDGNVLTQCDDNGCESVTFVISGDTLTISVFEEDSDCNLTVTYTKIQK